MGVPLAARPPVADAETVPVTSPLPIGSSTLNPCHKVPQPPGRVGRVALVALQ